MSIKDGGPAYPCPGMAGLPNGEFLYPEGGMSLRDHFAGLAMQGLIALNLQLTIQAQCKEAYLYADAMIAAKEQRT